MEFKTIREGAVSIFWLILSYLMIIVMILIISAPFPRTPLGVVSFFFAILIVFHLVFVVLSPLSTIDWKIAEYLYLGLAALSIFIAGIDARAVIAKNKLQVSNDQVEWNFEHVKDQLEFNSTKLICFPFKKRSDYKYDFDFDENQKEYDKVCEYIKSVSGGVKMS